MADTYGEGTPRPVLDALIEAARDHKMTWQEGMAQRRSFIFGQMPDSYTKTREEFDAENRLAHPEWYLDEAFAALEAALADATARCNRLIDRKVLDERGIADAFHRKQDKLNRYLQSDG